MSDPFLAHVIVGLERKDDAAVNAISDTQSAVLSVDFSLPFCDAPDIFGAITLANALTDI